jgi:Cu-Zn family superoxide dismutase
MRAYSVAPVERSMIGRSILRRSRPMKLHPLLVLFPMACIVAACTSSPPAASTVPSVVAVLQPTRGNSAAGTVWLTQDGSQVLMRGRITGLVPDQEHGFHVHEKGDCTSGDGMSAGGHLNPSAMPHGPQQAAHHAGDLPALKADASGPATVRKKVDGTVLGTGAGDLARKALVVHASPDDYSTQPTGNSGARIACGVVSGTAGDDVEGRSLPIPKDL